MSIRLFNKTPPGVDRDSKGQFIHYHKPFLYHTNKRKHSWVLRNSKRLTNYPSILGKKQKSLVLGSVLGDASLAFTGKRSINAIFVIWHAARHLDYLNFKYEILKNFVASGIKEAKVKGYPQYYFRTISHPLFTELRNVFYPDGKKVFPLDILNELDEMALAIWFFDDGNLKLDSFHRYYRLATCGYTIKENKMIASFLNGTFGLNCSIAKGAPRLIFPVKDTEQISEMLEPYAVESMRYKLYN